MTNYEILRASLLDILFERRNKAYGAYALRKNYHKRLWVSLAAGLFLAVLFTGIVLNGKKKTAATARPLAQAIEIRQIVIPAVKIKEPEPPKQTARQKPAPKIAQVKFTSKLEIKKDKLVVDKVPAVDELAGKKTGDMTITGKPDDGKMPEKQTDPVPGTGTGPSEPVSDFKPIERDPEFPGGPGALQQFLLNNLHTPDEMEAGEKKLVQVKFKVGADGSVSGFEFLASGGPDFDKEVVRVFKKMPRWIPAYQNGMNVPVSYIIPVTFIGPE